MAYNTSNFEMNVRMLPKQDREKLDLFIKNYIRSVLIRRGEAYRERQLIISNKVGKDTFQGWADKHGYINN